MQRNILVPVIVATVVAFTLIMWKVSGPAQIRGNPEDCDNEKILERRNTGDKRFDRYCFGYKKKGYDAMLGKPILERTKSNGSLYRYGDRLLHLDSDGYMEPPQ